MKKESLFPTIAITLIVTLIVLVFMYIVLIAYLPVHEVLLVLLFPVSIATVTLLINQNGLKGLKREIIDNLDNSKSEFKKEVKSYVDNNRFICHGSKYGIPNRSEFWNNFLVYAKTKFILLGKTNHSWVTGGKAQSILLGNSILNILENGGIVKILSENDAEIIENNKVFIQKYVIDKIKEKEKNKRDLLIEKFENNFAYKTNNNLNFTAVVSDDRLIILPRMNNESNHEKCMVLEINHSDQEIYKNYFTDIETIFDKATDIDFDGVE